MLKYLENEDDFAGEIKNNLLLVDFYTDWCGPCKMLSPILEELDVDVLKVNVDTFTNLAIKYSVMSVPTLIFFKDGDILEKELGFKNKEELEAIISKIKND